MQLASLMLIAASYLVDSSHTTAGFAVKHMMVATVRGQFDTVAGKVEIDDADLTRCRIDVTIEAASVDTRNAKRDDICAAPISSTWRSIPSSPSNRPTSRRPLT